MSHCLKKFTADFYITLLLNNNAISPTAIRNVCYFNLNIY